MRKLSIFLTAILLALSLEGCALLQANTQTSAAVNQGITLATIVYIQHHAGPTPASEYAFAQQVKEIATDLQGVVTGSMTITQFNAEAAKAIAGLNDPVKQQLAADLLSQLDLFFAAQVANKGSLLNATVTAAANIVFSDIIAGCAVFTTTQPVAAKQEIVMQDGGSSQLDTNSPAPLKTKAKKAKK